MVQKGHVDLLAHALHDAEGRAKVDAASREASGLGMHRVALLLAGGVWTATTAGAQMPQEVLGYRPGVQVPS